MANIVPRNTTGHGKGGVWKCFKPLTLYIDLEHATCYSRDNYWCALTDGKIKYVWRFYTGQEELFDLVADPQELHNAVNGKEYKERLEKLRARMIRHLSERGEEFVKDGRLVVRKKKMLYSPHYPKEWFSIPSVFCNSEI